MAKVTEITARAKAKHERNAESPHPYETHIPEGEYQVALIRCETGNVYGSARWFGHFQIVEDGQFFGLPIFRFWNRPKGKFIARTSNLAIDFMNVAGRRPPSTGLTPEKFLKGCQVLAHVVTVRHRNEERQRVELPEACWYSKIDRIIKLTAGRPPCL